MPLCNLHHVTLSQHTHTHLMALCPGLNRSAATRKVKPIWILLKQETVSGSGISWAIYASLHLSPDRYAQFVARMMPNSITAC